MSPSCSPAWPGISRAMLCIVLLSGLCSCLQVYYFIDEPLTWNEAQRYCREKHTDLVTIANMDDVERLMAAAADSGHEGLVWIGLYDNDQSWRWSLSDEAVHGNQDGDFTKWDQGYPSYSTSEGQVCGVVLQGLWLDTSCDDTFPFVCYDKTNTPGSSNTSSERYVFIQQAGTWHEAQAYCRLHHTDLASARSEEENTAIQQVVPAGVGAFIGLYRRTWMWSDGSEQQFKYWGYRQPDSNTEDCVGSSMKPQHQGRWRNRRCTLKHPFVCYGNQKQLYRIKLTALKSTIDLNDPAVTEAILKLVEQKLKEKGVTAGVKLRWMKQPDNSIFHKVEKQADLEKTCDYDPVLFKQ